jgi:hypothetical protein
MFRNNWYIFEVTLRILRPISCTLERPFNDFMYSRLLLV